MRKYSSKLPRLCLALILVANAACFEADVQRFEATAEFPLGKVSGYGPRIVFYPAHDVAWSELAPIGLFEGLRPGMTIEEAKAIAGAPDRETNRLPGRSAIFKRPKGNIIVAYQISSSGYGQGGSWYLRFEPIETNFRELLHPAISAQLEGRLQDHLEVVIMTAEGPAMSADLRGDMVQSVSWLRFGKLEDE
jgi:hypothetical protein